MTRDDVYLADEAFFCGTAAELTPIVELDRRRIGAGQPGAMTQRLMADFGAAARGQSARYAAWLTPLAPCVSLQALAAGTSARRSPAAKVQD